MYKNKKKKEENQVSVTTEPQKIIWGKSADSLNHKEFP